MALRGLLARWKGWLAKARGQLAGPKGRSKAKQPGINIKELRRLNKRRRKADGKETWVNKRGNVIELINVSKIYLLEHEVNEILRDVSFEIAEGEIVAIFGRSGSGKSTLINLISGLDRPTEGHIIVKDKNLPYLSTTELTEFRRKNISFIFQYHNLLQNITCYDNADTGLYLQEDPARRVDILELFRCFEIEHQIHRYPSQVSGGQQQRVSIIRALAKNAPILFADEPTASLDQATSKLVINFFLEMRKRYNTTVIIISHDPQIFNSVDKVIFVENQSVRVERIKREEEAAPDELKLKGEPTPQPNQSKD